MCGELLILGKSVIRHTQEPTRALFVPPVANLKTASALALDDVFAMQRAQFDLSMLIAKFWRNRR